MEGHINSIGIISILIQTGILTIAVIYINRIFSQNKEQYDKSLEDHKESVEKQLEVLKDLNENMKNLADEIVSFKIEMVDKYVKKEDLDKFKRENIEAHKELRSEIRELERKSA